MVIEVKEIAELLHIQDWSADVYVELLTHGELSEKNLLQFIARPEKEIDQAIDELLKKNLIRRGKNSDEVEILYPVSALELDGEAQADKEAIRHLQKFVIPQISLPKRLGIVKYEGWDGIRKVYLEILEEALSLKEDIYAFESNVSDQLLGISFIKNYTQRRIDNKIKAYVIAPDKPEERAYKKEYQGKFTEVKLLKDINIDANINVVGNLVMTFSTDPPQGTLRRNIAEANTLRSIFEMLWKQHL